MNIEANKKICEDGWESERLCYRKLSIEDVEDMYEYASEEKTCQFLKWGPYTDISQVKNFIVEKIDNYKAPTDILFGIELKEEKKLIGVVRIYNISKDCADLSYIQNPLFCGKGYMMETVREMISLCFIELNVSVVQAYFAEGNIRSERVMINSGMKKDEDYKSYVEIKGKRVRMYKYKIESEEKV